MTQLDAMINDYKVSINGRAMRKRLEKLWGTASEDPEVRTNLINMTPKELFEAWMDYEGIIGYADTIIQMLRDSGYVVEAVDR